MDIAQLSMDMSAYKADSAQGMLMLKKAKEQMQVQGENLVDMIESSTVQVNDGKSLDVHI